MTDVLMPRLSDSMEEGTILAWLKQDGDEVRAGEPLVEIETDKATVVYEADSDGTLEILAAEGATIALGQPIARIVAAVTASTRVAASPVARRMARVHGIDLGALAGRVDGRIHKADVERAIADLAATSNGDGDGGRGRLVPLTRVQTVIAERMAATKATVPEFTVAMTVAADACRELREQLKQQGVEPAPSVNDLVVRAAAVALKEHPRLNASFRSDGIEFHERVDVGIAVATDDALHVPVIRGADQRPVLLLAAESRRLAGLVRSGSVSPADLDGGTFTVSNLGMFGVSRFTAIINSPQVAILAVGGFQPSDGRTTLELTLTCDHRVVYGAHAAAFLGTVRTLLENPLRLLV